ncbi:exopolyphosphatase/guanosine-5'-triphosphate,3'-diphosphate pyrophosphatase [Novosphingobium kunmingense]|uniref:Exopolyphosphatase/guanosine-5'-triphosphate, 3'-diphosphate pyrophosphatase n=1 Tax=Novosphingobium kunmingense TaxID=1211806 RepID=A0A2N0H691_9SPHN|nr:Ppx/GppA family phosphatase [Novosphingobium kunmingense]PKB14464.1 exopolyphosphatase/guanosine-5'-triphosphate,3'-diphosphate pyrophosphatase [Novosphingobium kunmingense]
MSDARRQAIIDIGSNTIRLVVFGGAARAPAVLFNEKLMAGLGRGLVPGANLDPDARATALKALARFAALVRLMGPDTLRVVATAAVRTAGDGDAFLDDVRALGLPAELLSGDDEAVAAGYGVVSAVPDARGLVADMGGGSLELVRVADGLVHERLSLPFGVIPVGTIRAGGTGLLKKELRKALKPHRWLDQVAGQTLYVVGGGWRTLARVHMDHTGWPLPVLGTYRFPAADSRMLKALVREVGPDRLVEVRGVSAARAVQLDDAAAMLVALVREVQPEAIEVSSFGLREGLLYQQLDPETRAQDPLIAAVHHTVDGQLPVPGYPDAFLAWSDGAFPDEPQPLRRLRHAASLMAGTGWASNPDFRVLAGEEMALHGSWVGVDAAERAMIAMALHAGLGGDPAEAPPILAALADADALDRALAWGLAMRLAQKLGGGSPQALAEVPLEISADGDLVLRVPRQDVALVDSASERRLTRLGLVLKRQTRIEC